MNRWLRSLWYLGFVVAATVACSWAGVAPAQDADVSAEIEPYKGPPIYLDEPEPPPPPAFVAKQVVSDKYENGQLRIEREIAKYSDNSYRAEGFHREYYADGQMFLSGQYRNGHRDGEWTYWHPNGTVCRTVTFKNGMPDGSWEVHRADETLSAKRGYKSGKRDGTWVIYDETGKQPIREEKYDNGKPDGQWSIWYPSGQLHTQITFKQGERDGPALEWYEDGKKRAELSYVANKVHGTATVWSEEGKQVVQEYDHGKLVTRATD